MGPGYLAGVATSVTSTAVGVLVAVTRLCSSRWGEDGKAAASTGASGLGCP